MKIHFHTIFQNCCNWRLLLPKGPIKCYVMVKCTLFKQYKQYKPSEIHEFCSFILNHSQKSAKNQTCCPTFDLLGCGTLIHGAARDCLLSVVAAVTCSSFHTHTRSSKVMLTLTQAYSWNKQSAAKRRPAKEKEREEKPESQQVI